MRFVFVGTIFGIWLFCVAAMADCIDYQDYIHWVGGIDTPGSVAQSAVRGHYAYVADEAFDIFDVGNPKTPTLVSRTEMPSRSYFLCLFRHYVLVGSADGISILDIRDPGTPLPVSTVEVPFPPNQVIVEGHYGYITGSFFGLRIVDLQDPELPRIVGSLEVSGSANGVAVRGHQAYIATDNEGVVVVDITNPTNPIQVGSVETGPANTITISGRNAYIGENIFSILSLEDPVHPWVTGSAMVPGYPHEVQEICVKDGLAFVAALGAGLLVYDVSAPGAPEVVSNIGGIERVTGVTIDGDYAYLANGNFGFHIIDIRNPYKARVTGSVVINNGHQSIAVKGSMAFLVGARRGIQVVDFGNPQKPRIIGEYTYLPHAQDIVVSGDLCCVVQGDGILSTVDVENPRRPLYLGGLDTGAGSALGVAVSGDIALVACGWEGLFLVDLSDPSSPVQVGEIHTPGNLSEIAVDGEVAAVGADQAVTGFDQGIQLIDISDPTRPALLGEINPPGYVEGLAIRDGILYVAESSGALSGQFQTIDISNPSHPVLIANEPTPGWNYSVSLDGNFAYLASRYYDLQIFNIENPTRPEFIGDRNMRTTPHDVAVAGDLVLVPCDFAQLAILPTQCETDSEPGKEREATGVMARSRHSSTRFEITPGLADTATQISFNLTASTETSLKVFDVRGRLVKTIVDGWVLPQGRNTVEWNGRDSKGVKAASGLYFCRLEHDGEAETTRLILVK